MPSSQIGAIPHLSILIKLGSTVHFIAHNSLIGGYWQNSCTSVICHGVGGILIPAKWRDLLKASHWSKQRQKLVTQSYSHSNRLMATRSKYVYTPRSMGNSYTEYPPP